MLKKILDMFFKNKTNNLTKDYQGQPKTTINETGNVLHNEIGPANPGLVRLVLLLLECLSIRRH